MIRSYAYIADDIQVLQGGKPVGTDTLKAGIAVAVDSYGDELDYSEALQVQITAAAK